MWALGFVDELDWPHEQCQADRLHELIFDACENTASFIGSARLRPLDELLDALELSTRQHWAIRDAHRRQAAVPANFDWNQPGDMVPAVECPVFGVIAERHYALNWLMRFRNAQWDTVDTPT